MHRVLFLVKYVATVWRAHVRNECPICGQRMTGAGPAMSTSYFDHSDCHPFFHYSDPDDFHPPWWAPSRWDGTGTRHKYECEDDRAGD